MLVGRIVGRTSPETFEFEVTDIIKKMDFVATRDQERHWVLGRIEGIIQEKNQTLATVSVIGYSDKRNIVKMPMMPFKPGSYVYKADDNLVKRVLGLKSSGLYVGLLDGSEDLKIFLDPRQLITKHLAILAKSGFGKSYLISVILEEFMENKIPAVIIDPHGEYTTLQDPNNKPEEINYMMRFNIEPKSYKKELQIFCLERNLVAGAKKLKFRDRLNYQEVFEMLPFRLTGSQMSLIYSILTDIGKTEYSLDDIKNQLEISRNKAKWGAMSVLDFLKTTGIFDTATYVGPTDIVKKGKISVVNLKGVDPDVQQLVVYKVVKDLFEARKNNKIPPFLLILEEAHNFCPERGFGESISSRVLRVVASEGRKFGMGLGVVTQRAARIDKNVLSQCSTQFFLRVTNPNDLRAITDSVEGITRGLESQIKILPIGTGVVVGVIDQPLIVNVRIKRSNHGGAPAIVPEKIKEVEEDRLYFYPKFLEEDIRKNIKKGFEQFRLVYYPMWRLRCKFKTPKGDKVDNIFIDGLSGELVFSKGNTLDRTKGLPKLLKLDVKEKAVLLYLTTYGAASFQQVSNRLRIQEKDLRNIIPVLKEKELLSSEQEEFKSNLSINFEEIIENQLTEVPVNYKYGGEMLSFKIKRPFINEVLDLFKPNAFEVKECYYPYWFVFYDDGNIDVMDALTGERDERLSEGKLFEELV